MLEKIFSADTLRTVIILLLLFVIYFSFKAILNKVLIHRKNKVNIDTKKVNTIKVLFKNLVKYILIVIGIIVVLDFFGFKVSSIIAGLGVFSAVLALSLQDSLKDFFAGIFIVLENQFSIGDIVSIGDFLGEVTFLGFKSTRITNLTGEVKIISNRNITEVINYSKNNFLALVDVSVAYEEDIDKVFDVLNELCNNMSRNLKNINSEVKLLGINELDSSSVIYRISVEVKYKNKYNVEREILRRVKKCFDENNIKIPYPQLEVHHGK